MLCNIEVEMFFMLIGIESVLKKRMDFPLQIYCLICIAIKEKQR